MGLFLTFITGLFFLLGILLNKVFKNIDDMSVLGVSLGFIVIISLIIFDIIPEVFESFNYWSILFIILGFLLLKIMDLFVPHHHHDHQEENDDVHEHHNHLEHISIITILALSLHNFIECMALYHVSSNVKSGILMCLGIAIHNIPLGFGIGRSIKNNKLVYYSLLVISGFLGGVVAMLIGTFSDLVTNYILSFTLGMLIYLALFELLKELIASRKNKYALYGIIVGIILVIIMHLI